MSTTFKVVDMAAFKNKKKQATEIEHKVSFLSDEDICTFLKVCAFLRTISDPVDNTNSAVITVTDNELQVETRHYDLVQSDEDDAVQFGSILGLNGVMPFPQTPSDFQVEDFRAVIKAVTM